MATVTGKVEAKSNKFGKFAILVNDTWYSSKFEIKAERGDEVEFDDGGSKWCQKLKVVGAGSGGGSASSGGPRTASGGSFRGTFPVPATDGTRSIVRQNSLTNATSLLNASLPPLDGKLSADQVEKTMEIRAAMAIDIARMFESYSTGDIDLEDAQEALKDVAA